MKEQLHHFIIELIKGDNSLVDQYRNNENDFSYDQIEKEADIRKLEEKYIVFCDLLKNFHENYRQLFKIAINEETEYHDVREAKKYLEIGGLFINSIQNIYLNPINYKLNQLNTKVNISKARRSIHYGVASVILAIIAIILSCIFQLCTKENSEDSNVQHLEKIDILSPKIDTIMLRHNSQNAVHFRTKP